MSRYMGKHRKTKTVEWVQIQGAYLNSQVKGEIPRQCFERITGTRFVAGRHNWIRNDHSRAIKADRHYREVAAV